MTWYYVKDGEAAGPISDDELISKLRTGTVLPTALVWRSGMAEWQPASRAAPQIPASPTLEPANVLATAATAATAAAAAIASSPGLPPVLPIFFCTACGNIIPADQLVRIGGRNVCGACKPLFVQQITEGMAAPVKVPVVADGFSPAARTAESDLADPWIRLVAHVLDLVFIGIPILFIYLVVFVLLGIVVGATAGGGNNISPAIASSFILGLTIFMGLAVAWVFFYWTFFLGRRGATPGMRIMKVKMVRGDRGPMSYGRALGRALLLYIINGFTMSLTNLTAFFDRERRTVVDMICDTRVVRS